MPPAPGNLRYSRLHHVLQAYDGDSESSTLQMLGGPPLGSAQRGNPGGSNMMRSSADGDEFAALAELPPDQAALWRRRFM